MPRDGSGIYTQPSPDVVEGTTIESAVYNVFTHDVETEMNQPRPIIAGGTGANNAEEALVNLKGEAAVQVVTNYDMHLWYPGSFRSAAGATGAPNATSAFAGIAYIGEALAYPPTNNNVIVEARDLDDDAIPGTLYVREKKAGVWEPTGWKPDGATALDAKVDVAGDVMTGNLSIAKEGPILILNTTAAGQINAIAGQVAGANRWGIFPGDGAAEGGGGANTGSDFVIAGYDDAGVSLHNVLAFSRLTGLGTVKAAPIAPLGIATKGYVDGVSNTASNAAFDVARSVAAAASPGTWTAVGMDTTNLDSNSCFISGFRFVPNVPGWYWIHGSINMPTSGGNRGVAIWKNGAAADWSTIATGGGTATVQLEVSRLIFFNGTTDYVELVGLTDYVGGGFNRAYFSGYRVRP